MIVCGVDRCRRRCCCEERVGDRKVDEMRLKADEAQGGGSANAAAAAAVFFPHFPTFSPFFRCSFANLPLLCAIL